MERPPGASKLPVRMAVALYSALLAVALLWRTGLYGEPLLFASEAAARAGLRPLRDAALGVAFALAAAGTSEVAERWTAWGRRLAAELARLVGPLTRGECLALALASGIGEEAFFRGALQPRVGLVAASVLFGLAHFPATRALRPWTAFALASGLALGLLFEATGNLLAPATAHILLNALGLHTLSTQQRLRQERGLTPL